MFAALFLLISSLPAFIAEGNATRGPDGPYSGILDFNPQLPLTAYIQVNFNSTNKSFDFEAGQWTAATGVQNPTTFKGVPYTYDPNTGNITGYADVTSFAAFVASQTLNVLTAGNISMTYKPTTDNVQVLASTSQFGVYNITLVPGTSTNASVLTTTGTPNSAVLSGSIFISALVVLMGGLLILG